MSANAKKDYSNLWEQRQASAESQPLGQNKKTILESVAAANQTPVNGTEQKQGVPLTKKQIAGVGIQGTAAAMHGVADALSSQPDSLKGKGQQVAPPTDKKNKPNLPQFN